MTSNPLASVTNGPGDSGLARVDFIHLTALNTYRLAAQDAEAKTTLYANDTAAILALGKAIVAALEPTPAPGEYPVGTRVLLKASTRPNIVGHAYVGKFGTVIADPHDLNHHESYKHFVSPDGVDYGVWFYADEVELAAPAAPATPDPAPSLDDYTVDDRVRVTSNVFPDDAEVGSLGTVTSVSSFVNVNLDGYDPEYSLPFQPDEIEPSDVPAPRVYKYPEGLYKSPEGSRIFVKHEDSPQGYEITYLDENNYVNNGMSETTVSYYALVTPA